MAKKKAAKKKATKKKATKKKATKKKATQKRRPQRSASVGFHSKKGGFDAPFFLLLPSVGTHPVQNGVTPSHTRTLRIVSCRSIRSTTSIPATTRANTVYRPSRCGCGE